MQDVKDLTMTEAVPTLWGAMQAMIAKTEALIATTEAMQEEINALKAAAKA
jgi:cytochrome c556